MASTSGGRFDAAAPALFLFAILGCDSPAEHGDASSDAPSDGPVVGADAGTDADATTPAPKLVMSGPIVIKNQSDAGFSGLHVVSDAGPCVRVEGSSHVVIAASEIGPCGGNGIELSKDDDVTIADSYIHPEHPAAGCCDTGDGVYGNTITNVTLQGNVIGEANIEVTGAQHVHVLGNFMLNPQNAGSRGQNFQAWGQCSDVNVAGNYTLSSTDAKYPYPEKQEDSINFGFTDGITATGNYVRGGHSPSGCGIIADEAANSPTFSNNVLVDTGQCGINISDGTNAIVDNNRIINSTPVQGGGNTGLVVWKEYAEACGPVTVSNNVSSELKPDMTTESGYWNGGGCDPVTLSNNTWDVAARAQLTPVDQKLPPPAIPPGPKSCVAVAPWTNQTVAPPCWSP